MWDAGQFDDLIEWVKGEVDTNKLKLTRRERRTLARLITGRRVPDIQVLLSDIKAKSA